MITNDLFSPALLHAMAIFIVALTVVQIAAYAGLIALAARQTTIATRTQFAVPLIVAALLAAWLGWAMLAVREPVVTPEPPPTGVQNVGLLLKMGAFFSLGIAALFSSKSMRAICAAIPPAWLIGVQIYRVAGVMFLWPFLAFNALPTSFALLAGIGDILIGVAAPFVVLALLRKQPRARSYAVAWNYFGILDFFVAVTAAVLSQSTNISHFPLVIVPLFIVPVGLLAHICSLRNLGFTRDLVPEGKIANLNVRVGA
jgi:hypothetical protein